MILAQAMLCLFMAIGCLFYSLAREDFVRFACIWSAGRNRRGIALTRHLLKVAAIATFWVMAVRLLAILCLGTGLWLLATL
uniref:Holin n=1 Tax=Pseudomonas phage PA_L9 TaxID=3232177 RepID=A0AAU8KXY7_9CAUD